MKKGHYLLGSFFINFGFSVLNTVAKYYVGKKLSEFDEKALSEMLELFEEYKSCSALSIAKQIDTLNKISNEKTEMICDGENIYVFSERVA